MKKLRVTVEGKVYEVLVEVLDEGASSAPAASSSPASSVSSAPISAPAPVAAASVTPKGPAVAGDVLSPLAGKLVSVDVKIGDSVAEGAQVATVEAMKMNTYIYAPKAGKITAISAQPGDGLEEGAVLLHIE